MQTCTRYTCLVRSPFEWTASWKYKGVTYQNLAKQAWLDLPTPKVDWDWELQWRFGSSCFGILALMSNENFELQGRQLLVQICPSFDVTRKTRGQIPGSTFTKGRTTAAEYNFRPSHSPSCRCLPAASVPGTSLEARGVPLTDPAGVFQDEDAAARLCASACLGVADGVPQGVPWWVPAMDVGVPG